MMVTIDVTIGTVCLELPHIFRFLPFYDFTIGELVICYVFVFQMEQN